MIMLKIVPTAFTLIVLCFSHGVDGDLADKLMAKLMEDPHSTKIIEETKSNYAEQAPEESPKHLAPSPLSSESAFQNDLPPTYRIGGYRSGDAPPSHLNTAYRAGDAPPSYLNTAYRAGDAPPSYLNTAYRAGDVPPSHLNTAYRGGDVSSKDVPPLYNVKGYRSGDARSKVMLKEESPESLDTLLEELKYLVEKTLENDKKELLESKNAPMAIPWAKRNADSDISLKKDSGPQNYALPWKKEIDQVLPLKKDTESSEKKQVFALPWKRDLYDRLITDINELFKMSDETIKKSSNKDEESTKDLTSLINQ